MRTASWLLWEHMHSRAPCCPWSWGNGWKDKWDFIQLQSAEWYRSKWLLIDRCLISNPFVSTPNTQRLQYNYEQINSIISKQLSVASIYFLFGLGSVALPDFLLHIRLASCSMPRFTSSSSRAALDVWILLCVWAALVVLMVGQLVWCAHLMG